jgi:hypothetical protein
MILCEWDGPEGHPGQCCIHMYAFVSYRRLSPQFKFSLSAVTLGIYLGDFLLALLLPRVKCPPSPPPLIGPLRRDIVIAPETLTRDDPLYTLAHTVEKNSGNPGGGRGRGECGGGAFQVFSRQHNSAHILGGRKKTGTGHRGN